MFENVLTISGKPGLYKLISSGRNLFIVETIDKSHKRMPVHGSDKVVMLGDIAIYTDIEEIPLKKVFELIYAKEGKELTFNIKESTPEELTSYFETVLPDYDKDRVYLTHIKKLFLWYNTLIANGIIDFTEKKSEDTAQEPTTESESKS